MTNPSNKRPVLEMAKGLPDEAWEDIGMCEEAAIFRHRPPPPKARRRRSPNIEGLDSHRPKSIKYAKYSTKTMKSCA